MTRRIIGPLLATAMVAFLTAPALAVDRDKDGLRDFFEKKWGVTDHRLADSDGDGVIDSAEDNDGDRLSDLGEQRFGTDPGDRDTDNDGKTDGAEDKDGNGRSNALEQDRRPLPKGLRPTLSKAKWAYPAIRSECFAQLRVSKAKKCILGDVDSTTTVVLYGDSHALMWSPAFIAAATQRGWRLVTFFKGGCPSVDVETKAQYDVDRNRTCDKWRGNVLAWISAHPPEAVVLTNSDGYTMTVAGAVVPWSQRPARWKQGLLRTLASLPSAADALVFGDAPENKSDPIPCLKRNQRNMSACVSRRQAPAKRRFAVVERAAAAQAGAEFKTLYGSVCSYDPCPLVQGRILIWRDRGHLTRHFAKQLSPSVESILSSFMAAN